jgi:hypothetical protein
VERRKTSLPRRLFSINRRLICSRVSLPDKTSCFRLSSNSAAGVASGVVAPESGSCLPRRPLCGWSLGAGKRLGYCSSSASVPLSLVGLESFLLDGVKRN